MCGICGIVGTTDIVSLKNMMATMRHRGPDDSGFHQEPGIALGQTRLSIIDISGGHQPMSNEDGTVWLVCNGEIYNFVELQHILEGLGHKFKTSCDSEVIVHAYEEYGSECVRKLLGMFSFAIWDNRRHKLLLGRDRLGIKPLYYMMAGDRLLFASEIKALLAYPGVARKISYSALGKYLTFRFVPAPETMFEGIFKVEPGTYILLEDTKLVTKRYWDVSFQSSTAFDGRDEERFSDLFFQSVASEVVSERTLGVYLSGGLDSSFLTAAAAKQVDEHLKTFSVAFKGEPEDESSYAKFVAEHLNTEHIMLDVQQPTWDLMGKVAWHLDEPLGDAAVIPTFLMAQATKPHATVVLSGEGADELLGGYPQVRSVDRARRWPAWLPGYPAAWVAARSGAGYAERFWQQRQAANPAAAFYAAITVFTDEQRRRLLASPELTGLDSENPTVEFLKPHFEGSGSYMEHMLGFYLKYWLPDDLLLKNDKMTMAHSVEARVPYLDHRLVEYAAALSPAARYKHGTDKYILRQAASRLLPKSISSRPKHGFNVPTSFWLRGDLQQQCCDLLLNGPSVTSGLFRQAMVKTVLESDLSNALNKRAFWTLLALEQWRVAFSV